jgi:hypothetical protein
VHCTGCSALLYVLHYCTATGACRAVPSRACCRLRMRRVWQLRLWHGRAACAGGENKTYPKAFLDELEAVHYKQPPWSTEFPNIDVTSTPCAPTLNVVRDNRFCFLPPPPPPPAPAKGCAKCPGSHPYPYGSPVFGSWCCSVPTPGSGCASKKICCLTPGSHKDSPYGDDGCEGIQRCGTNPVKFNDLSPNDHWSRLSRTGIELNAKMKHA